MHCDAKAGQYKWDQMRVRVQQAARAADRAQQANVQQQRGNDMNPVRLGEMLQDIAEAHRRRVAAFAGQEADELGAGVNDGNYLHVVPPKVSRLPDPASLPCVKLLGTIDLPVRLARGGLTASGYDQKLAPNRFGLRFKDLSTKGQFDNERCAESKNMFNLCNFFTKTLDREPKYMELRPMFRPGDPRLPEAVSFRVLVVDSTGMFPPTDVAVEVKRDGKVKDLLRAIRAQCAVGTNERLLLATVEWKPEYVDTDDPCGYYRPHYVSKISSLYTSRDGAGGCDYIGTHGRSRDDGKNFENQPLSEVHGFVRDYERTVESTRSSRAIGEVARWSPNGRSVSDVLVAYRLPGGKVSEELVIVHP